MQRDNELRDLIAENERLRGVLTDMHGFAIEQIKGTATDMEAAGVRAIKAAVDNINTQLVQPLMAERDAAVAALADRDQELADLRAKIADVRSELLHECDGFAPPDSSFEIGHPEISPTFWVRVRAIHDRMAALASSGSAPTGQEER
jgi:sulfite reductase beta subunit-like hemoprotein